MASIPDTRALGPQQYTKTLNTWISCCTSALVSALSTLNALSGSSTAALTVKAINVSDASTPLLLHSVPISLIILLITLSACTLDIIDFIVDLRNHSDNFYHYLEHAPRESMNCCGSQVHRLITQLWISGSNKLLSKCRYIYNFKK